MQTVELLYKDEVFAIIGAAIEVHKTLGHGFLEAVYQEALEIEAIQRTLPFNSHKRLKILYKGKELVKEYEADMVFYDKIIVELKAASQLASHDDGQLLNYLKATGYRVGLLINFGSRGKLEWKRMIL
jgi:GxxExxY protein